MLDERNRDNMPSSDWILKVAILACAVRRAHATVPRGSSALSIAEKILSATKMPENWLKAALCMGVVNLTYCNFQPISFAAFFN